jgi:hypothetical protein
VVILVTKVMVRAKVTPEETKAETTKEATRMVETILVIVAIAALLELARRSL